MRKPRRFEINKWSHANISLRCFSYPLNRYLPIRIYIEAYEMDASQCIRLANWLKKASQYLKQEEKRK